MSLIAIILVRGGVVNRYVCLFFFTNVKEKENRCFVGTESVFSSTFNIHHYQKMVEVQYVYTVIADLRYQQVRGCTCFLF